MDTLSKIRRKLKKISKELEAKQAVVKSNREAAIALCYFITDTIRTIDPNTIEPQRYGSYDNPVVGDYPFVTICASYRPTFQTLANWRIDTGGKYPPPAITTEEILQAVLQGLNRVQIGIGL